MFKNKACGQRKKRYKNGKANPSKVDMQTKSPMNLLDQDMTLYFLKKGYLHLETEAYITHIFKINNHEKWKKRNKVGEFLDHITSGWPSLGQNSYLGKRN